MQDALMVSKRMMSPLKVERVMAIQRCLMSKDGGSDIVLA